MNKNHVVFFVLVFVLLVGGFLYVQYGRDTEEFSIEAVEDYHIHVDLSVYILGEKFDFSLEQYQSGVEEVQHPYLHFHDEDGDILHVHQEFFLLEDFFASLNISLTDRCITFEEDSMEYCADEENELLFYVNGEENTLFGRYKPEDLDQVVIYYGPDDAGMIDEAKMSVTDRACIFSLLCPERGVAPPESSCVSRGDCLAI